MGRKKYHNLRSGKTCRVTISVITLWAFLMPSMRADVAFAAAQCETLHLRPAAFAERGSGELEILSTPDISVRVIVEDGIWKVQPVGSQKKIALGSEEFFRFLEQRGIRPPSGEKAEENKWKIESAPEGSSLLRMQVDGEVRNLFYGGVLNRPDTEAAYLNEYLYKASIPLARKIISQFRGEHRPREVVRAAFERLIRWSHRSLPLDQNKRIDDLKIALAFLDELNRRQDYGGKIALVGAIKDIVTSIQFKVRVGEEYAGMRGEAGWLPIEPLWTHVDVEELLAFHGIRRRAFEAYLNANGWQRSHTSLQAALNRPISGEAPDRRPDALKEWLNGIPLEANDYPAIGVLYEARWRALFGDVSFKDLAGTLEAYASDVGSNDDVAAAIQQVYDEEKRKRADPRYREPPDKLSDYIELLERRQDAEALAWVRSIMDEDIGYDAALELNFGEKGKIIYLKYYDQVCKAIQRVNDRLWESRQAREIREEHSRVSAIMGSILRPAAAIEAGRIGRRDILTPGHFSDEAKERVLYALLAVAKFSDNEENVEYSHAYANAVGYLLKQDPALTAECIYEAMLNIRNIYFEAGRRFYGEEIPGAKGRLRDEFLVLYGLEEGNVRVRDEAALYRLKEQTDTHLEALLDLVLDLGDLGRNAPEEFITVCQRADYEHTVYFNEFSTSGCPLEYRTDLSNRFSLNGETISSLIMHDMTRWQRWVKVFYDLKQKNFLAYGEFFQFCLFSETAIYMRPYYREIASLDSNTLVDKLAEEKDDIRTLTLLEALRACLLSEARLITSSGSIRLSNTHIGETNRRKLIAKLEEILDGPSAPFLGMQALRIYDFIDEVPENRRESRTLNLLKRAVDGESDPKIRCWTAISVLPGYMDMVSSSIEAFRPRAGALREKVRMLFDILQYAADQKTARTLLSQRLGRIALDPHERNILNVIFNPRLDSSNGSHLKGNGNLRELLSAV